MSLAFEELVQQILAKKLEDPKIHTVREYSEADEQIRMAVHYNGEAWDATKKGNEISLDLLKNATREMTWQWTDGSNQVNLLIRS